MQVIVGETTAFIVENFWENSTMLFCSPVWAPLRSHVHRTVDRCYFRACQGQNLDSLTGSIVLEDPGMSGRTTGSALLTFIELLSPSSVKTVPLDLKTLRLWKLRSYLNQGTP